MGIFHQIGHDCINLVGERPLNPYSGLIWSPVNYKEDKVTAFNRSLPQNFARIFDPQLYFPDGEKRNLLAWDYYPEDFETTDNTNPVYWDEISKSLIRTCQRTGCNTLCSPTPIPKQCNNGYYDFFTSRTSTLVELAKDSGISILQTVVIKLDDIDGDDCVKKIATIISRSSATGIYLIFSSSITPRRELKTPEELTAVMKLIYFLKQCSKKVIVGFCSSDFILWRYAGADDIATGKYFNLRRFTANRFLEEEAGGGGGQLSYMFDKSYLAFFREGDILRLDKKNLLDPEIELNPYNASILNIVRSPSHKAWVALSWKSYLYSMMILESTFKNNDKQIVDLLATAEQNWERIKENNILMEEVQNNGSWIRRWRIALNDFDDFLKKM